jgi:hypothetical protein
VSAGPGFLAGEDAPEVEDSTALQIAFSYAAKALAAFDMGLMRIGRDALRSASELAVIAFPAGSTGAISLARVLDAVERVGAGAAVSGEWERIVAGFGSGEEATP